MFLLHMVHFRGSIPATSFYKYPSLRKFLSSMENSDRFMKVADIQIKSNAQSPKKHDVEILVLTYVLLRGK